MGKERSSLSTFRRSMTLLTPWFQTPSLQDCKAGVLGWQSVQGTWSQLPEESKRESLQKLLCVVPPPRFCPCLWKALSLTSSLWHLYISQDSVEVLPPTVLCGQKRLLLPVPHMDLTWWFSDCLSQNWEPDTPNGGHCLSGAPSANVIVTWLGWDRTCKGKMERIEEGIKKLLTLF